jgi:hypothetical protein
MLTIWDRRDFCRKTKLLACNGCHTVLFQRLRSVHDLLGPRAHAVVLRKVHPANHAGRIQQEFRWPRHVLSIDPGTRMQQIISANDLGFWIGEKGICVAGLATQIARHFRCVHADRYWADAKVFNLRPVFFDTP